MRQSTLKVRLPVLVQPLLPRFARQSDRFYPGGVARLVEGAEGPAAVEVRIDGKSTASQKVELKSGKAAPVSAPMTVKAYASVGEAVHYHSESRLPATDR